VDAASGATHGAGSDAEQTGGPEAQGAAPVRRSTRRRVVAPPTNPAADQSDDVPAPARRAGDHQRRARVRLDPRDSWILEQRPPHWD